MNRVELALQQRKQNIINVDETELLTSIAYATTAKVIKPSGDKQYSNDFLSELLHNGIVIGKPNDADDGKWHFVLPDPGMLADED